MTEAENKTIDAICVDIKAMLEEALSKDDFKKAYNFLRDRIDRVFFKLVYLRLGASDKVVKDD